MTSLFFAPINMQKTAGRMGFMISNNQEINRFWSEENIDKFNANIVKNLDSLVDSKINIFENFIYNIIEELQEEELFGDITFYLISNIDTNSNIDIIHISEKNMRFINHVAPKFFKNSLPTKEKDEWNHLIFSYSSKDKKGKFRTRNESVKVLDTKLNILVDDEDKKIKINFKDDVIENKNYKSAIRYFNPLISNFIQNKSLLGIFKRNKTSWHLTEIYLKEIRGMREERLEAIKNIAEKLMLLNENDDKKFIRKVVFPIEKTKSQSELRTQLREFMRKLLVISEEPLLTAEDMVFRVLPQGESWHETKDILLIALYEKLVFDEEIEQEFQKLTTEGEEDYE